MKFINIAPGVTARAFRKTLEGRGFQEEMEIGTCGAVRSLDHGDKVKLVLNVSSSAGLHVIVFKIDGKRDILPLDSTNADGNKSYEVEIPIEYGHTGSQRYPATDSKSNYLMLATFDNSGDIRTYCVCLVGQLSAFFLVNQPTHSVKAYRNHGTVVCPDLLRAHANWEQLNDLAATHYEHNTSLPAVSEYVPMKWNETSLKEDEVIVTVWSARRGSGGGVNSKGQGVAIFWADIEGVVEGQPACVSIGEIVKIKRFEKPRRRTNFVHEGRGITRTGEVADMVTDPEQDAATSNFAQQKKK